MKGQCGQKLDWLTLCWLLYLRSNLSFSLSSALWQSADLTLTLSYSPTECCKMSNSYTKITNWQLLVGSRTGTLEHSPIPSLFASEKLLFLSYCTLSVCTTDKLTTAQSQGAIEVLPLFKTVVELSIRLIKCSPVGGEYNKLSPVTPNTQGK